MVYVLDESFRLRKMAGLIHEKRNVLDVGCAQLSNRYLENEKVTGLDIDVMLKPDNYSECRQGTLKDIRAVGVSFDGILAGEILEHLEDPLDFLKDCYSVLESEGKLVLSTPNPHSIFESLLTLTLNKKYFYTEDHIMLFPQRWLIRMLEVVGFEQIQLHSGGFPLPPIGLVPFPRPFCYQTIAVAVKR